MSHISISKVKNKHSHPRTSTVYLVYEDGATQASPPSLTGVVESTVLSHRHHVNRHAVITGLLCSQSKVEAVTCVVLHNEQDTRRSCVRRKVLNPLYFLFYVVMIHSGGFNVFSPSRSRVINRANLLYFTCIVQGENGSQDAGRRRRRKYSTCHSC